MKALFWLIAVSMAAGPRREIKKQLFPASHELLRRMSIAESERKPQSIAASHRTEDRNLSSSKGLLIACESHLARAP